MKEIDQMLKQWIPVNDIIREEFRNVIIKAMNEHANNMLELYTKALDVKIKEQMPEIENTSRVISDEVLDTIKIITDDYKLIDNIEVDGIDTKDYPDFCDAFIASADYDGKPMTDEQLEELNKDSDFVYECVQNHLF